MEPISLALPNEITDILNSREFDDESGIVIDSVKCLDKNIDLIFSICFDEYTPDQKWKLTVNGVEEEKIHFEWIETLEFYETHVLLLKHKDIHSELYLSGMTADWEALLIDIFQSLLAISKDKEEISKYILIPEYIKRLCSQSDGLFARGPKTILKIYEQSLIKHGVKPIYIGEYNPSATNSTLKLLKLGDSYIIGQTFNFERLV